MNQKLETVIKYIIGAEVTEIPLAKINIPDQFHTGEEDNAAIARNLNAAFLISLSGESHPLYKQAARYLNDLESHPSWKKPIRFYKDGINLIRSEISSNSYEDGDFEKTLTHLYSWIIDRENIKNVKETIEKIRRVFFPEGVSLCEKREEKIEDLREKRKVEISKLNPSPVTDPAREILFTSNILVTIPSVSKGIDNLPVSTYLQQMLKNIVKEEQLYWYDHPIPMGIDPAHNEVLYGLEGLDKAVEFEKLRGSTEKDEKITCVLSVSVTHEGLQGIVKEYLEDELRKEKNIKHLNIFVFTEADTLKLIENILIPAAEKFSDTNKYNLLFEVIGVDGEYGRHYSFLKAIAAIWQVLIDPEIKGTFKTDLDQVFPQEVLVAQSGLSAFEHFKTPLWGAEAVDNNGNLVELGMIAGALVNQKDIEHSLFSPDVCFPASQIKADELIFFSSLPQALSTEGEMMTRYTDNNLDGTNKCIQRIHVTGGTNGILIHSLREHRPFTPTFIGRAEDQAYILSVLLSNKRKNLRYVHKDGLIMRHDKEAFAGEAIKMAATGKLIEDYIRILMFSYYARALPWSFNDIKNVIDPFTGCFVSKIPLTIVYMRFALKLASFFTENTKEKNQQGFEFFQFGIRRLHETIKKLVQEENPLIKQFQEQRQGWTMFYKILDKIEEDIKKGDAFALDLKEKAKALIETCKVNFSKV
jgi:hypothetical protein